ncbi:MAG TPA: AMP-binding protein [Candidatus Saccharicenans sp.]|nr:AMP-binding protein [Candidatus Saccharicenans sp.]HPU93403.1 AMP-binding protein [Candidatus Saccharicenans sp.]
MQFDPVLVPDWLTRTARHFPDKIALVSKGQRLTYRQIDEKSTNLASALILLGFKKGDRTVICLDNSSEAVISIYGIMKAGGVFTIIDPKSPWPVINSIIADSEARILITVRRKLYEGAGPQFYAPDSHLIIVDGYKSSPCHYPEALLFEGLVEKLDASITLPRLLENDLACLIYTSGSTGRPKGIICTHHNMVTAARSIIQYLENTRDDVILDVLPLSFDYGLYQIIMCFMFGGTVILESSFAYVQDILAAIEKEKVTGFPLIPSISAMLLKLKKFPAVQLKSLRYITNTGAAWPVSHIRHFRQFLPQVKLYSMYGLSECKRVSYLPPDLIDKHPDSVGIPMPNLEVAIVDGRGHPLPAGKPGQLIVRGPTVMQGYWRDEKLTRKVFRPGRYPEERWLQTGDIFRQDENGLLYYVGRRDRQIKSFGHRINLSEIEQVIAGLDGLTEVAAIPVPDEIGGEVVGVFVVAKRGRKIAADQIKQFCRQYLEPYKIPRRIWQLKSLPKTANGKIDYKKLLDSLKNSETGQKAGQKEIAAINAGSLHVKESKKLHFNTGGYCPGASGKG